MAAELRWILLALSLVLLVGIWWWGRRSSSQAPGDDQLREITPSLDLPRPEPSMAAMPATQVVPAMPEAEIATDWAVPPLEPLSIRTHDFERVPVLDIPMMVHVDPTVHLPPAHPPQPAAQAPVPTPAVTPGRVPTLQPESIDRTGHAPAQAANAAERQKIVTVRVCAAGDTRWPGTTLLSALEQHGLAYGRYQVFHRRHTDGKSLFCVASLKEPGTFDVARMVTEEFKGVTLFAVLPGPVEPLLTVDELLGAARGLAQELMGMVQDSKGMPLSPQRAAALRDDVARFQASLARG